MPTSRGSSTPGCVTPLSVAQENAELDTAVLLENQAEERLTQTPPTKPLTKAEQAKATTHVRRQARYEQVYTLQQAGCSQREIGRQTKLVSRTIVCYLATESCPQYSEGCNRLSKLRPYLAYLQQRWQAGCTNATQLWREIVSKGFAGFRGLVSYWAVEERKLLPAPNCYSRQQLPEVKPLLSTCGGYLTHPSKQMTFENGRIQFLVSSCEFRVGKRPNYCGE